MRFYSASIEDYSNTNKRIKYLYEQRSGTIRLASATATKYLTSLLTQYETEFSHLENSKYNERVDRWMAQRSAILIFSRPLASHRTGRVPSFLQCELLHFCNYSKVSYKLILFTKSDQKIIFKIRKEECCCRGFTICERPLFWRHWSLHYRSCSSQQNPIISSRRYYQQLVNQLIQLQSRWFQL